MTLLSVKKLWIRQYFKANFEIVPTTKSDLFIGLGHSALKASVSAAASAGVGGAAAAAVPQRRRRVIQRSHEVE